MSRAKLFVLLLAVSSAAGCAGSRENLADTTVPAAEPEAVAAARPTTTPLTVDGNALAQRGVITCREILKPNSNVHINQCMTAEDWRRWERLEAQRAAELVRMMQGGRYR
jgi:hypothetical protein